MSHWSFDSYPADDAAGANAKRTARAWLDDWDYDNLYLYGPVGSGKTGLAWACVLEFAAKNIYEDPVQFCNVRQVLTRVRRSFGTDKPDDPTDELIAAPLLVLDDLGSEKVTDWTREWLASIVEGRYVEERRTIVTSNYAPSALAKRLGHDDPVFGQRILSRLTENCIKVKLDRLDLRARRAA
jgi:DNA replication protein DnaC/primosomal protein DnaI